ncbi:4-methylaminobutanoate oxidase (formaldehyde-forming) [Aeromicrobium panaciterrae]|uniref:4-methylaminobutanoate oxidase (Formaldehyde-forming) n=1 Tax=Aeromicrobium panaciterrae TaxID=363861 RepID=A0ABU1UL31_9ACTN|nr:FAD-dependent oxidoreductase [Aeromicrobium panaciterrae]MDR7085883.1 4-methylaminobutanoate oxidase (formaldehyde-forming) [Aeromicrobium panaciterrae]
MSIPSRARIVIIGGGIVGTSVAYHLTLNGESDVVLLEQGELSSGTTWHAAGLVGQLRATQSGTTLVQYSASLYEQLEAETGLSAGFKRCGGVTVARTEDRMEQLRRTAATATAYNLECELLTPEEAGERWPLIATEDLVGGLWLPGDGTANPTDVTQSLARGARRRGATVVEHVRVLEVLVEDGAVTGVRTDQGDIEAEIVVNCAGQWAHHLAAKIGVSVPLHSAEHFYVVTDQIEGVRPDLPILRDPDGYTYFKEEVGGLVVGGFEPVAKPWVAPDEIPYPFEFQLLGEDWEHFQILMDSALERIPVLHETGIRKFYNGPESFTPDNQFILGEAPSLRGFFVGAGFNSVGIASAGGAGRALAEWILEGEPSVDLLAVDIRRFAPFQNDKEYLRARVAEVLGLHYAVPWPNREFDTARPLRTSPLYERLRDANAGFGSKMGWERANFFAPPAVDSVIQYAWGKQNWLPWSAAEQKACREAVAVFDQTSFSKYVVHGADAEAALQWICSNDVAVANDETVYTALLNSRGGYESDLTVTRVAADEYFLVSSSATTERDQDWIRRNIPAGLDAHVADVTDRLSVLGVMGPHSRALLSRLTNADLSEDGFAFGMSREIQLAGATIRATRITYVGELGWELYIKNDDALQVYEAIKVEGAAFGIVDAGYYAIEAMRLEKGYRAFGRELTPEINPVEAGLSFTCKLATDIDFIGRAAVEKAKATGASRRIVSFACDDPSVMIWGGELLVRDGIAAGQAMSGSWGATIGSGVGLAWINGLSGQIVDPAYVREGAYELDVGGRRIPVRVSLKPLFDPAGDKIRPA